MSERIKNKPKKSLGQNYLTDENISSKIVDVFNIGKDDCVVELGAGQGAITKYIVPKTKNIIAVELDENNCRILEEKFYRLTVINEDILTLDLEKIAKMFKSIQKLRVIGNIPYSITTPILFKMIENRKYLHDIQLMMQDEVAKRIAGKPNTKDYGIPSVLAQVYSEVDLLFKVSRNSFYPKPRVDSRILKLTFTDKLADKIMNEQFFRKFVRAAFSTRRKTLRNSLKSIGINANEYNINFDFTRRAENLSVSEFIELSNKIYDEIYNKTIANK